MLVRDLTRDKREALLAWLQAQGLDPAEIADDGYFAVHNGRVRGHKFIGKSNSTVHFSVPYEGVGPDL